MKIAKRLRFNKKRADPVTRFCARCGAPNAAWGFGAWKAEGTWFCWGCVPPEWTSIGDAAQQVLDAIQTAKGSSRGPQDTGREDDPMTITVLCVDYKPLERGTLQGFCTVRLKEVRLLIKDVAVHEKDGKRWAQLPSKPRLDANRELVRGPDGKILYTPMLEFDSREVADAFSRRVLDAVATFRAALEQPQRESAP